MINLSDKEKLVESECQKLKEFLATSPDFMLIIMMGYLESEMKKRGLK